MTANPKNYADVWKEIPWKSLEKSLFILQNRIYKAAKNNNIARVKQLQRLLICSKSSKLIAVRDVSQLTTEKKKTDFIGLQSLDKKQSLELTNSIRIHSSEKYDICVTKLSETGKSILTSNLKEKICQCILKYALEPVYEASVSTDSYWFRSKKNAHEIRSAVFKNIRNKSNRVSKKILKIELKKCFGKVRNSKLLRLMTLPSFAIKVLRQILTSGVFLEKDNEIQTGIISSLLTNIALHGLEDIQSKQKKSKIDLQRAIRYDGDLIFFLTNKEDPKSLLQEIRIFLTERGLDTKNLKIKITEILEGFDFLNWTFRVKLKSAKYLCYPTSESKQSLIKSLKKTMVDVRYNLQDRIKKMNLICRDWFTYYKGCPSSKINLWSIKHWSYDYLMRRSSLPRIKRLELIKSIFDRRKSKIDSDKCVLRRVVL